MIDRSEFFDRAKHFIGLGTTDAHIATAFGVNPSTVNRWRSGQVSIPFSALRLLEAMEAVKRLEVRANKQDQRILFLEDGIRSMRTFLTTAV